MSKIEIDVWTHADAAKKKKEIKYKEMDIFKFGQTKKSEWVVINITSDVQVKCKSEEECLCLLEAALNYLDNEDELILKGHKLRKKISLLVS